MLPARQEPVYCVFPDDRIQSRGPLERGLLLPGSRPFVLLVFADALPALHFARGDLLILCTAMMSAAYNTTISRIAGKISQPALVMSLGLVGTAQIIPLYLWETDGTIILPPCTPTLVWSLLYLAIFASILCFLFWNEAVHILGAPKAMLFYYTLPPISGLVAWLVIDEPVSFVQFFSGMIILAGILFALYGGIPKPRRWKAKHYGQPAEIAN